MFNLAGKSRKTVNAQQEAQKYPLCSSFYKFFTDRRTARIKVLTVYLLPGPIYCLFRGHFRKLAIEVSELYVTFAFVNLVFLSLPFKQS